MVEQIKCPAGCLVTWSRDKDKEVANKKNKGEKGHVDAEKARQTNMSRYICAPSCILFDLALWRSLSEFQCVTLELCG